MYHYNNDYISYVDNPYNQHRSHWIIHRGGTFFYRAEFETQEQLDIFAKTLGFTYELAEERDGINGGKYREYNMSKNIVDPLGGGFWRTEDLPENVKPIKALSNGSIVTCYYCNTPERIEFYRPNPNAKDIYKPLTTDLHIAHQKIYGSY